MRYSWCKKAPGGAGEIVAKFSGETGKRKLAEGRVLAVHLAMATTWAPEIPRTILDIEVTWVAARLPLYLGYAVGHRRPVVWGRDWRRKREITPEPAAGRTQLAPSGAQAGDS